jgi:sugar/nucleoside kinase (ribokinase family)
MTCRGLFAGAITIDIQYLVDSFPGPNTKSFAEQLSMSTGGPATNAAVTFSHLGGQAHLLTVIGSHPYTRFMTDELQRYGVTSTDLVTGAAHTPPISSIITTAPCGDRSVVTWAARNIALAASLSGLSPRDFDIVLVDGFYMKVCRVIAEQAKEAAVTVVLDAGSWKFGMEPLLPSIDIAICSETFSPPGITGQAAVLNFLRDQGIQHVAITRGGESIIYSSEEGAGEIPVGAVEVVDTLGAGDILHGAFCYFYAESASFAAALEQAARVATLSCQSFGTRSWMHRP